MMAEYSRALGNCIYKKRKELRWTQAYLAERSGVTEQTIRKIEHYDAKSSNGRTLFACKCASN